jgi:hypothetical protein
MNRLFAVTAIIVLVVIAIGVWTGADQLRIANAQCQYGTFWVDNTELCKTRP